MEYDKLITLSVYPYIYGGTQVLNVPMHSVHPPPDSRVGLRDFAISSLPVGLGFFKIQGGVVIVGWG